MFSSANEHRIGNGRNYGVPFNGSLSQFYLDGQALGPEEFGYTDPLTNTWRPKKYEGVSKADTVLQITPTLVLLSASSDFLDSSYNDSDQTI